MINPVKILEKEHGDIGQELAEFETIMDSEVINYPNLVHVFKRFCGLWDAHEDREEKIFEIMNRRHLIIPVEKIKTDHVSLRKHLENIKNAVNSGDDYLVRKCLDSDLKVLISKIRTHINIEDEVLYTISFLEFSDFEWDEMRKYI